MSGAVGIGKERGEGMGQAMGLEWKTFRIAEGWEARVSI